MKFTYNNKEYELILLSLSGSRLYGNYKEDSDWDYRGIFIASSDDKLGLFDCVEQLDSKSLYNVLKEYFPALHETNDIVLYELRKFFKLAADNNPNILDILCAPKNAILYSNEKWDLISENKHLFLSKKIKHTFSGYAYAQLKRLEGHNKRINKYPKIGLIYNCIRKAYKIKLIDLNFIKIHFTGELAESLKNEFGDNGIIPDSLENITSHYLYSIILFGEYHKPHISKYCIVRNNNGTAFPIDYIFDTLCSKATYDKISENTYHIYVDEKFNGIFSEDGNIKSEPMKLTNMFLHNDYILSIDIEAYKAVIREHEQMWSWKINRNTKRGEMEDKIGYDVKHGSHLIRLLLKALTILSNSKYNPILLKSEINYINKIKNGEISYEKLIKMTKKLDERINTLYETSNLQKEPQRKEINNLLIKLSY